MPPLPDHFATFSLARAPWLEAEELKARFFALSAERHPDAGGAAGAFTELNAAWQTLRDPAARLRHFLELEHPEVLPLAAATPSELGDLFMEVAGARQAAQQFSARLAAVTSPLARSLLEPERLAVQARVDAAAAELQAPLSEARARLAGGEREPSELARLLGRMVYLGKWAGQLGETGVA